MAFSTQRGLVLPVKNTFIQWDTDHFGVRHEVSSLHRSSSWSRTLQPRTKCGSGDALTLAAESSRHVDSACSSKHTARTGTTRRGRSPTVRALTIDAESITLDAASTEEELYSGDDTSDPSIPASDYSGTLPPSPALSTVSARTPSPCEPNHAWILENAKARLKAAHDHGVVSPCFDLWDIKDARLIVTRQQAKGQRAGPGQQDFLSVRLKLSGQVSAMYTLSYGGNFSQPILSDSQTNCCGPCVTFMMDPVEVSQRAEFGVILHSRW